MGWWNVHPHRQPARLIGFMRLAGGQSQAPQRSPPGSVRISNNASRPSGASSMPMPPHGLAMLLAAMGQAIEHATLITSG